MNALDGFVDNSLYDASLAAPDRAKDGWTTMRNNPRRRAKGFIDPAGDDFSGVERNFDIADGGCKPNNSDNVIINHMDSRGIYTGNKMRENTKQSWLVCIF